MRTWRIQAQVIACNFCCFSQRALHGLHNLCNHRNVVQWGGYMRCPCLYCLYLAGRVWFSTQAPVQSLTTANQRRTLTRILSTSSIWRTPAIESRYSFYRMGWVNPESERKAEILFLVWVGFEPTTSWSTVQLSKLSPLSNRKVYIGQKSARPTIKTFNRFTLIFRRNATHCISP